MTLPLAIRADLFSSTELRAQARRTRNRRTVMRMLAIANALDGMSRAESARVVGMERQALRDAVIRYNAEGLAGLRDRPKPVGWQHINLTGDYLWDTDASIGPDGFRPLRHVLQQLPVAASSFAIRPA